MKIDQSKSYRTIGSKRNVRLYAYNNNGWWHGAYETSEGNWNLSAWNERGIHQGGIFQSAAEGLNLEEAPEVRELTRWTNIYENGQLGALHKSLSDCLNVASSNVFAIAEVKIKVERGENIPKT